MIFVRTNIISVVIVFSFAALTDWLDGQLARKFKWESEFGRKADMIADRFLWTGTALAFVISFGLKGSLNWVHGIQLLFIMSREIICAPFAIVSLMIEKQLPKARYIAKATTFLQGFALPSLLLSVFYLPFVYVSVPLSIVCLIIGSISARHYIKDTHLAQTFDTD